MSQENNKPHFSVGHFCGGCNISNNLHTGCITDGSVRIVVNAPQIDTGSSEDEVKTDSLQD